VTGTATTSLAFVVVLVVASVVFLVVCRSMVVALCPVVLRIGVVVALVVGGLVLCTVVLRMGVGTSARAANMLGVVLDRSAVLALVLAGIDDTESGEEGKV